MDRMTPDRAKSLVGLQTGGKLSPCPSMPNCVCSSHEGDKAHYLPPIPFKGSIDTARQRLKEVLKSQKNFKIVEEKAFYLRVEVTSSFFKFVDDLEFVLNADEKKIHFRSASRLGYSDLGANRKRINMVLQLFEAETNFP